MSIHLYIIKLTCTLKNFYKNKCLYLLILFRKFETSFRIFFKPNLHKFIIFQTHISRKIEFTTQQYYQLHNFFYSDT